MKLEEYLQGLFSVDTPLQEAIEHEFRTVHISKGQILFQLNQVARRIYFIENGLARMYYFNDSGKDITYEFFPENNFLAPSESFLEQKPSNYSIELVEDAHLRVISLDGLERLLDDFPIVEKIKSHILARFLHQANKRIVALQFQNAQQRYETLENSQGNILLRAPLGHIASYLGITQETLSRIRSRK